MKTKLLRFLLSLGCFALSSQGLAQTITQATDPNAIRLSAHRPLYFLYGDPSGKVQLSAKEQIFTGVPLYVGYTQLMLWQFGVESTPFSDVNFNPELLYRFEFGKGATLDLGIFEHVSNGKAGPESRSVNTSNLGFSQKFESGAFMFEPGARVSAFWALDEYNRDYREYLGIYALTFRFSLKEIMVPSAELNFEIRPGGTWGGRFDRGYQQMELALRLDRTDFLPYLYVQYFSGYGESLITYNQWSSYLRIGLRK